MNSPFGRVLIIGTGLMGTSVGLALQAADVEVLLTDADASHLRLAVSLGAGIPLSDDSPDPDLVIVGVPPALLGRIVADALHRYPNAIVTDLGSVKAQAAADVRTLAPDASGRYAGGHPMAGSEQSGPLAARDALFDGRAWAVTPHPGSADRAVETVEALATICGAFPVRMTPAEHDEAVALVSHVPQVAASVVAGLLTTAAEDHLLLAGQGLRDVTRIAAGDPAMWTQILSANARPVARLLHEAAQDLQQLAVTLDKLDATAAATAAATPAATPADDDIDPLRGTLERGGTGVRRLPGKHGAQREAFALVPVLLPDQPGELARLFANVGEAGVNIEDIRIDHSPGTPAGLAELAVAPSALPKLLEALEEHGWSVHG
ncbi:prephenate dehydrogenase [Flindersiella endophytica]